jgi:hypothetical protein
MLKGLNKNVNVVKNNTMFTPPTPSKSSPTATSSPTASAFWMRTI